MERIKLLTPDERKRVSHVTQRVNNYFSIKTMYERKKQDVENKSVLGGVQFFYKYDTREDGIVENVTLCWDIHPSEWNNELIIQEIDRLEIDLQQKLYERNAEERDEAFGFNPNFNPFL